MKIKYVERNILWLQRCLEQGAEIKYQDGKWYLFAKNGEALHSSDSLYNLIME